MPESYVIFTGRPNAGKSSIIKALTGLKISTGKRPGTTTSIDKYEIAQDLFLVDMPGYGRKVDAPRSWEDKTKDRILDFIYEKADQIIAAVHVLNIMTFIETEERLSKKGFISIDVEMVQYLEENIGEYPFVAANKIDKGNDKQVMENLRAYVNSLTDGEPELAAGYVFPISAKKGVGIGELKSQLVNKLQKNGYHNPFEFIR
ncbi:MAG: 50S ribosome-binding GTPase [Candidatus Bathyarchaeota archaeon]|nr:50S ribosome-binding GTPase [Candidatus Bathyarchaeota archaeon]